MNNCKWPLTMEWLWGVQNSVASNSNLDPACLEDVKKSRVWLTSSVKSQPSPA